MPQAIYDEIREQAEKHDRTVKDVVRQCLKFGLVAMKIEETPGAEIVFREKVEVEEGVIETKETLVQFIW